MWPLRALAENKCLKLALRRMVSKISKLAPCAAKCKGVRPVFGPCMVLNGVRSPEPFSMLAMARGSCAKIAFTSRVYFSVPAVMPLSSLGFLWGVGVVLSYI